MQDEIMQDSFGDGDELDEFSGTMALVMWANLLQLLCVCRRVGCGAQVLPDNMKPTRKGT